MSEESGAAFLDSSVVVRYLTDDPPHLAERAAKIIESEHLRIVSELVLVEVAYVLTSVYGVARASTVDALQALIRRRNLKLLSLSKPVALEALSLCRDSRRVSFADAMQWAQAREIGPPRIYTFDRRFPDLGVAVLE